MNYLLTVIAWLSAVVLLVLLVLALVTVLGVLTKGFMLALEQAMKEHDGER